MEAGLKQNKIEAWNAASGSFKIITETLLGQPNTRATIRNCILGEPYMPIIKHRVFKR
jgi:hypothetical protein